MDSRLCLIVCGNDLRLQKTYHSALRRYSSLASQSLAFDLFAERVRKDRLIECDQGVNSPHLQPF